jgi:predicted DNA-binding transcriptional regulator AlpA
MFSGRVGGGHRSSVIHLRITPLNFTAASITSFASTRKHEDAMTTDTNDRLLNPDETAERCGFTRRFLEMMDDPPPSFKLGRLRRFPESALNRWIARKLSDGSTA